MVLTILALVDTLLESEGRPLEHRVSVRTFCGGFSSTVAYIILAFRKQELRSALRHLRVAATGLQTGASAEGRVCPRIDSGRVVP